MRFPLNMTLICHGEKEKLGAHWSLDRFIEGFILVKIDEIDKVALSVLASIEIHNQGHRKHRRSFEAHIGYMLSEQRAQF